VRAADPALGLQDRPALEALRRIWLQQYYRCTVPGLEAVRWRTGDEQPPAAMRITSPYDLEARYSSKRETHWVGYKVHLTETCDADHPDLMTQVMTTPATTQDSVIGPKPRHDFVYTSADVSRPCWSVVSPCISTLGLSRAEGLIRP
jgi:hypothetical protein